MKNHPGRIELRKPGWWIQGTVPFLADRQR